MMDSDCVILSISNFMSLTVKFAVEVLSLTSPLFLLLYILSIKNTNLTNFPDCSGGHIMLFPKTHRIKHQKECFNVCKLYLKNISLIFQILSYIFIPGLTDLFLIDNFLQNVLLF